MPEKEPLKPSHSGLSDVELKLMQDDANRAAIGALLAFIIAILIFGSAIGLIVYWLTK